MRIRISKRNLFNQINTQSAKDEFLEEFILDGAFMNYDENLPIDPLKEIIPKAETIFVPVEYSILRDLAFFKGKPMPTHTFFDYIAVTRSKKKKKTESLLRLKQNTLRTHVKNIRKKILKNQLPILLETIERTVKNPTYLRLSIAQNNHESS